MTVPNIKYTLLLISTLINYSLCFGLPKGKKKEKKERYIKYNDRLILTWYGQTRSYELGFTQKDLSSASKTVNFKTQIPSVQGFELDYDKLSISADIRTVPIKTEVLEMTGLTTSKGISVSAGGNKWILSSSWRKFTGFYDIYSGGNINPLDSTITPYFQKPDLAVSNWRERFLFFTNHKNFAYKSAYGYSYRQLHSSATWVFGGLFYLNRIHSSSSFFPANFTAYDGKLGKLNDVTCLGAAWTAGLSVNIVIFKRWFFNFTGNLGPDFQWRTFAGNDVKRYQASYIGSIGEIKTAFGFNNRNLFFTITGSTETVNLSTPSIGLKQSYIYGGFNLGYRFFVKERKWIEKMKENKFYKKL